MVQHRGSCYKECTCEIWKPYLFWLRSYCQGQRFLKVGQTSRSMSLGQKCTHGKVLSQGMYICNMKALPLLVKKLCPRLKFFKRRSRSQGQKFGTHGKVLSQGMHICNIKALPLLVRKLWPRLIFFLKVGQTSRSRSLDQKFCTHGRVLSQGIHMLNMKALPIVVHEL